MPEPQPPRSAEVQISPPLPATSPDLPSQINNATKSLHTELNGLITARLPLALPPISDDPALYAIGISVYAQIYFALEKAHSDLIATATHQSASSDSEPRECHVGSIRTCLSTLIPSGLRRTERLQHDLNVLEARTGLDLKGNWTSCQAFVDLRDRLESTIPRKPHILLAYQWVMYMAIFSGGRWIRQRLRDAGQSFWTGSSPSTRDTPNRGFSVFEFDEETKDGEHIKSEFKKRLALSEQLLTDTERREIVEESELLFNTCIDMVHHLDSKTRGLLRHTPASDRHSELTRHGRSRRSSTWNLALLGILVACGLWKILHTAGSFLR